MAAAEEMARLLEQAGYTVTPPPPPRVLPTCHYCDNTYYLSQITVITNPGEEGYDHRTLLYCEMHEQELIDVLEFLTSHGFATHYHGSTMFLTDINCPGQKGGECPSPEESPYEREEPSL